MITHFVLASLRSSHAPSIVHRLITQTSHYPADPSASDHNVELLSKSLEAVSANLEKIGKELVIVISGLDNVERTPLMSRSTAFMETHDLAWLPQVLPPGVKLLLSVQDAGSCDAYGTARSPT